MSTSAESEFSTCAGIVYSFISVYFGQIALESSHPEPCCSCFECQTLHPNIVFINEETRENRFGVKRMPQLVPASDTIAPLVQGLPGCNCIEDFERVAGWAQAVLKLLLLKRDAIAKRVRIIKSTIVGLVDVFGSEITDEELRGLLSELPAGRTLHSCRGLTDACRRTLREFSRPLTTREVCSRIEEASPEVFARQKEPRVSVTVVLRRLVNYGQVQANVNERNVRTWLWVGAREADEVVANSALSLEREAAR